MVSRRRFLQSTASLALLPLLPRMAASADLRVRPSWDQFCLGPYFTPFCNAIAAMRANTNAGDPNSWQYWAGVHRQLCPHGVSYFLAWHRGFLYRFEARVRALSGEPGLVLPYWNYYANPQVPAEFLVPGSPLYRKDRTGTDVSGALSLDPFADTIINFQRGKTDAFEPLVESRPHNGVHNLIGGMMSNISYSPLDPLFWVHHANIDRLWVAWITAGGGRRQPAASNAYWTGSFSYGSAIKAVPRVWTANTTSYLGYTYDDVAMPDALPPTTTALAAAGTAEAFSLSSTQSLQPAAIAGPRLGASQPLTLDERSLRVAVPLSAQDAGRVRSLMMQPATAGSGSSPVRVVLDGVQLTGLGRRGGFFYKVFLNLPAGGGAASERAYLLGTLGPFEIGVAQMKAAMQGGGMQGMAEMHAPAAARLEFAADEALRRIWPTTLDALTVSFVRVDGSRHPPKGDAITVQAFSVEADPAP